MAKTVAATGFQVETVALAALTPHPQNYRAHPEDQIAHLAESLRVHGQYRNIVVAQDGTILAGHGVALACQALGWETVVVRRLPLDPLTPAALKVLAGDNEMGHLAEVDDRALTELLKTVKDQDEHGLLGTGYDDAMLANLVMVTRPASEIADFDEAAAWAGMPSYELPDDEPERLTVKFRSADDRADLCARLGLQLDDSVKSIWWPPRPDDDVAALRFEERIA